MRKPQDAIDYGIDDISACFQGRFTYLMYNPVTLYLTVFYVSIIILKPFWNIFVGVPSSVTTAVHLCCGYPSYLDHEGYKKADKQLYVKLASLLDKTGINQVI